MPSTAHNAQSTATPGDGHWVIPPGQRPFGWAGWLLNVPQALRPFRIEGNSHRGRVGLCDQDTPRLELAWATVSRRYFNPDRFARRRLTRALGNDARPQRIQAIPSPGLEPLLHARHESQSCDRWVGYAPATRRVLEVAWRYGPADEIQSFIDMAAGNLTDQRTNSAQRWAFYGISFVAPARFVYHRATLNLGDMLVRLTSMTGRWRAALAMRHIYPAALALARRGLDQWLTDQFDGIKNIYRIPGQRRDGPIPNPQAIETALGPGLMCDAALRTGARLVLSRRPHTTRSWLIHDTKHDRLIAIQLADDPKYFHRHFDELVAGLHWAK